MELAEQRNKAVGSATNGSVPSPYRLTTVVCKGGRVVSLLYKMSLVLRKTGLRGFRPGPTQTGLYSHRRWLET